MSALLMFVICNVPKTEVIPTRCLASYSNGFCFGNMMPGSFKDLIYLYYSAYPMGCYQNVISNDNGGVACHLSC